MVIKKYIVNNMNEALTRIRHELGKDAVIISQRKIKKPGIKGLFLSKQFEVTAAIENYTRGNNSVNRNNDSVENSIRDIQRAMQTELLNKSRERKETETVNENQVNKVNESSENLVSEVREMRELLNAVIKNTSKEEEEDILLDYINKFDIDLEFYDELNEQINLENIDSELRKLIKDSTTISTKEMRGNIVLIGPTGVGKTTTIAKLAGRLALIEKKKVGLITIDTYRIGAVEQLKTYAEIMSIPFKVVITTKEMEEAVESMKDCDVVLIDTTGRSSKNTMQISELRAYVEKANADSISLVISATTKNNDIKTILSGYSNLNYDNLIITKLDETTTYGALYNIQKRANKPLSYITTGQNVPDDIKVPTKEEIVRFVFGEETLC